MHGLHFLINFALIEILSPHKKYMYIQLMDENFCSICLSFIKFHIASKVKIYIGSR